MSFGKLFTICVCLASSLLLFSSVAQALSDEESYQNALKYTHKEFSTAVVKLNDKTAQCSKNAPVNALKVNEQLPTIKEQDLKLALAFLVDRNVSKCIHNDRANTVFALSSLELLIEDLKERGVKIDDTYKNMETKGFYEIVGGTSPRIAYLHAEYRALPEDVRSKIESIKELQRGSFNPFKLFDKIIELRKN